MYELRSPVDGTIEQFSGIYGGSSVPVSYTHLVLVWIQFVQILCIPKKMSQADLMVLNIHLEVALMVFRKRWIPMEERYLAAFEVEQRADLCIDTTC